MINVLKLIAISGILAICYASQPACLFPDTLTTGEYGYKDAPDLTSRRVQVECQVGNEVLVDSILLQHYGPGTKEFFSKERLDDAMQQLLLQTKNNWIAQNPDAENKCVSNAAFEVLHSQYGNRAEVLICSENLESIDKPLVLVEGYDFGEYLGSPMSFQSFTEEMNVKNLGGEFSTSLNLLDSLKELGYDVFMIDLPQHVSRDLWHTASLVQQTLAEIWNRSEKNTPMKIVGLSTGGVWATIATMWEYSKGEANRNFKVSDVITSDSPHSGAYLPLAIQELVKSVDDLEKKSAGLNIHEHARNGVKSAIQNSFSNISFAMRSISARQLVLSNIFSSNNEASNFFNSYHQLVRDNASNGINYYGMVSGSWIGAYQGLGDNTLIMTMDGHRHKNIDWSPDVDGGFKFNLFTQPYSNSYVQIMNVEFKHRFSYESKFNPWGKDYAYNKFQHNFENMPGGNVPLYLELYKQVEKGLEDPYADIDENQINSNFLPVSSSAGLGILDQNHDYSNVINFADFEQINGNIDKFSFLKEIYHQEENLYHARVRNKEQQEWLLHKILGHINIVPTIITPLLLN